MKWKRNELLSQSKFTFDEEISFDTEAFRNFDRISDCKDLSVWGSGSFTDEGQRYEVDLHVAGTMICPCAITNEPVEVPFETESHQTYLFGSISEHDEDVHVVKNDILDLTPAVFQTILLEVPLKVVKKGKIDYPKGEGWQILSEADYLAQESEPKTDPRLAKLKEFKFDDEEV